MTEDGCFECDSTEGLEDHHVIPQSRGGVRTVKLCGSCHGLVHDQAGRSDNLGALALAGKARVAALSVSDVESHRDQGKSILQASRDLGMKKETLKRFIKNNEIDWPDRHNMRLPLETRQQILPLYEQGLSLPQVADALGVHHGCVGRYLRNAGLTRRKGIASPPDAVVARAKALYALGMSQRRVAKIMDLAQPTVWRYLKLETPDAE